MLLDRFVALDCPIPQQLLICVLQHPHVLLHHSFQFTMDLLVLQEYHAVACVGYRLPHYVLLDAQKRLCQFVWLQWQLFFQLFRYRCEFLRGVVEHLRFLVVDDFGVNLLQGDATAFISSVLVACLTRKGERRRV